ncbi:sensor histidine kinase [Brachybacterium hainanense]|uniref:Sensor-like histidine kinase SenX3 n=1 Tax=Brachybacterium hainanense TaxID=1541174 RepID=A0ABV6RGA3_9MICO
MSRHRPRALPGLLVAAPLLLGGAVSLAWWASGGGGAVYLITDLAWIPLGAGAALALLAIPGVLGWRAARRRAEDEHREHLREHGEPRRRLLSRLDHELKNPLQGIRAALADEPSDRQRASIDAQSRRLVSLLGDLRKIGEVEHTVLELAEVDPSALAEEAAAAIQEMPGASERRISLALPRAPRPLPRIPGDEDLLFLVLVNALSNAVKYSRPGDAVEVRGREEEAQVILEIADTGQGIAPDELPLVWEELGRGSAARGIEGSGLGLPLVRAIVERHGGSVSLESWLGEGSTLTLRLPRTAPRP